MVIHSILIVLGVHTKREDATGDCCLQSDHSNSNWEMARSPDVCDASSEIVSGDKRLNRRDAVILDDARWGRSRENWPGMTEGLSVTYTACC